MIFMVVNRAKDNEEIEEIKIYFGIGTTRASPKRIRCKTQLFIINQNKIAKEKQITRQFIEKKRDLSRLRNKL